MVFIPRGSRTQVGWNINSAHSQFISQLLIKANNLHLQGLFHDWYWHFSALRDNINHELKKDERDELNKLEKSIDVAANNLTKSKSRADRIKYHNEIREYTWRILDLMKNLGYLPSKEDKTKVHL